MTTNWKYTDPTNYIVVRVRPDGGCDSCLASSLPEGTVIEPADPIIIPPITEVTPRQFRQGLTRIGLRAAVESAVAAADQDTKDWYEYSTAFLRSNPVLIAMAAAMGKTSADIDNLFTLAATL